VGVASTAKDSRRRRRQQWRREGAKDGCEGKSLSQGACASGRRRASCVSHGGRVNATVGDGRSRDDDDGDDDNDGDFIGEGEFESCERGVKLTRHQLVPKYT
jgi:hypothetical protein